MCAKQKKIGSNCLLINSAGNEVARLFSAARGFFVSGNPSSTLLLSFLTSQLHYKHNFQSLWHVMEITMFISTVMEVKADKFRLIPFSKNITKLSPK